MGNTNRLERISFPTKDHPHIHGEYVGKPPLFRLFQGSPPHTWGIRRETAFISTFPRITPTYMGNTCIFMFQAFLLEDHPHIHGEYSRDYDHQHHRRRITPTYMGNTRLFHIYIVHVDGSPPHTWGILL